MPRTTPGSRTTSTPSSCTLHHNLVLTLAVAAASYNASFRGVLDHARKVKRPRTLISGRPMVDDEILLLRLVAHLMSVVDPSCRTASGCVLAETALTPAEALLLAPESVDDLEAPLSPPAAVAPAGPALRRRRSPAATCVGLLGGSDRRTAAARVAV